MNAHTAFIIAQRWRLGYHPSRATMSHMSNLDIEQTRDIPENQVWQWVQPHGIPQLLKRLAHARDFAVPERERENLCSVAHGQISADAVYIARLRDVLDQILPSQSDWRALLKERL